MNYRQWCERAKKFIRNLPAYCRELGQDPAINLETEVKIAPPLTSLGVKRLEKRLRLPLPSPLRDFLLKGSRQCYLHYWWGEPKSGGDFCTLTLCDASKMAQWQEDCHDYASNSWLIGFPAEQDAWLKTVPFAWMPGGDFLALDVRENAKRPPVTYLNHDGELFSLAPNFRQFLEDWEALCYIGPDQGMVEEFRNRKTGFLDSTTKKAAKLRKAFGLK